MNSRVGNCRMAAFAGLLGGPWITLVYTALWMAPGMAQLIPDETLGAESSVIVPDSTVQGIPADLIEGGASRGANLFHSFTEFNIQGGQQVYFASPVGIENILSRVTGGNVSNINGLLGVDGTANLFLLNPNGVVFGPDARLDIGGSFVTSTAGSFGFVDGSEFSAAPPANELLTMSVPMGVQFNDSPQGDIVNSGELTVAGSETLTLLGNNVLNEGTLRAEAGVIQVFGNQVSLMDGTTVDVAGDVGGQVLIDAETVDAASGLIDISGTDVGGSLAINAASDLNLGIVVDAGGGGNAWFDSPILTVDAAAANTLVSALAGGGMVTVSAADTINIDAIIDSSAQLNASTLTLADENVDTTLTVNLNAPISLGANQTLTGDGTAVNVNLATPGIVQNSLDVAAAGATVNLAAGIFQEGTGVILDQDITLNGAGGDSTILDGNDAHRVLQVADGVTATIGDLTVANGNAFTGAGILTGANSTVILLNSVISNNDAVPGGGGIFNSGSLTILNSFVSNNSTDEDGGGVLNTAEGNVLIENSVIDGNFAPDSGGGIANSGLLTVRNSLVEGNASGGDGGGIVNFSTGNLTIEGSTVSSNTANLEGGGLSGVGGTITVAGSTLSGNTSQFSSGAGIRVSGETTLTLLNSTLADNSADGVGGGLSIVGNADVTVENSAIINNSAGGNGGGVDINSSPPLGANVVEIRNSTLSGNSANSGGGGVSLGSNSTLTLEQSTVTENTAGTGSGIANVFGGQVTVSNSIVAGNVGSDTAGGFTDAGNNLIGGDPLLAPLADNGGTTQTHALLPGSPGIDTGTGTGADQRGVEVVNGIRDIGAFESRGFDITVIEGNPQSTNVTQDFAVPLVVQVSSAFAEPIEGGTIAFSAPEVGASAFLSTPEVIRLDASGLASVDAIANTTAGDYVVAAETAGALLPGNFDLSNTLFSTFLVDNLADENDGNLTPGNASLREGLLFTAAGGTINFDPILSGGTITLGLGELTINRNLTIDGLGAEILTISGNTASRVFAIGAATDSTIANLTISDGVQVNGVGGGGLFNSAGSTLTLNDVIVRNNSSSVGGGGIRNDGTLTLNRVVVEDNSATNASGGGINNVFGGNLTVNDSLIVNNTNTIANGGGLSNFMGSTITINTSTLSGNTAVTGGGLFNDATSTVTLNNSTVTQNSAVTGSGVAISDGGQVTLNSTIVAGNSGTNVSGAVLDTGNNLIDGDPLLAPLADYGGPTQTHALLPGSVAIDAGSGSLPDQRGFGVVNGSRDIGAFESQGFTVTATGGISQATNISQPFAEPLTLTIVSNAPQEPIANGIVTFSVPGAGASAALSNPSVLLDETGQVSVTATANATAGNYEVTASAAGLSIPTVFNLTNFSDALIVDILGDENDGQVTPGDTSLREAILFTASGGSISFDPGLSGGTVALSLGELTLDRNLSINGLGAGSLAVSGSGLSRVFTVSGPGTIATIRELGITAGNALAGGGIQVGDGSTLTLENVIVTNNSAADSGGGVQVESGGTLAIANSTISGNIAQYGGGIYTEGNLTVANSFLSGNTAQGTGGAIATTGTTAIASSVLEGNIAQNGGGIDNLGTLTIANSTVSNNTANTGAGVYNLGTVQIAESTFSSNTGNVGVGVLSSGTLGITDSTLDDVETLSGNASLTGTVTTVGSQIYRGPVTAAPGLMLQGEIVRVESSLTAGGELRILSTQANAGDVTVNSSNPSLTFSGALVGGDLTINTSGAVNGTGQVAGQTVLNGAVVSGTPENPLIDLSAVPVVVIDGDDVTVTGAGNLDLSSVPGFPNAIAGNLDVSVTSSDVFDSTFSGTDAIALTGPNNQFNGALSVITELPPTTGVPPAISQSAPITVDGTLTVDVTPVGTITLNNSANALGEVQVTGNTVSLAAATDLTLGASTVGEDFTVASGGNILDSGNLLVNTAGGATVLNANNGTADITLDSANNQFGALFLTGNDVLVTENAATLLGGTVVNGTLTVNSAGAITQTGGAIALGTTTFNAGGGSGDITLDAENNLFGPLELTGNTVSIRENSVATLGPSDIIGNLAVRASDVEIDSGLAINGRFSLRPFLNNQAISVGVESAGFSLDADDIANINAATLTDVVIGSSSGSGNINWSVNNEASADNVDEFDSPVTLLSPDGNVAISSPVLATPPEDVTLSLTNVAVEAENISVSANGSITLDTVQLIGTPPTGSIVEINTGSSPTQIGIIRLVGPGVIEAPIGFINILADAIDATTGTNNDLVGGAVTITSTFNQTLTNIALRAERTPENDIISTGFFQDPSGFDPSQGTEELQANLEDVSDRIRIGCGLGNASDGSQFIVTGRGGLPPNPSDALIPNGVDVPWVTYSDDTPTVEAAPPETEEVVPLIEAQGIRIDETGTIYFVADAEASEPVASGLTLRELCAADNWR